MRCRPLIPSLVVVAAVAVLAAGCGGSSPPTRPAAAATDPAREVVAFAACMRSRGLSSYPDPKVSESAGHSSVTISPGGLDPNSPAFKSASRTCGHLLPNNGSPAGGNSPQQLAQVVKFAACMRSHGVPNFPDPDRDGAITLPSAIDQQAPQFQRATNACANVEPSSLSIFDQPPGKS